MTSKILNVIKILVVTYLLTGVMLLLLALGLYKFNLSNWQITAGIVVTYALSAFLGGYALARKEKTRRLLWGMAFGVVYFAILAMASLVMNKGLAMDQGAALRAVLICVGAGAIGAFATPVEN